MRVFLLIKFIKIFTGVNLLNNSTLKSVKINNENDEITIEMEQNLKNKSLKCDHIIVALGTDPNVELTKISGLKLDEV